MMCLKIQLNHIEDILKHLIIIKAKVYSIGYHNEASEKLIQIAKDKVSTEKFNPSGEKFLSMNTEERKPIIIFTKLKKDTKDIYERFSDFLEGLLIIL